MRERWYCCIDLKSFYASVECVARGLHPLTTRLVVADPERTRTTICLAVSPAMKALGVKNRCRLYQVPKSISYITAPPRMRLYMETSAKVYGTYLSFVSKEDVHPYSVDEAFIDLTGYLGYYGLSPEGLAARLMDAVHERTGIYATAGVGTNPFLAKVALDVLAKHEPSGIACLDEERFKERIWFHRPITDIWRIGHGTARRLERYGVRDLAGVAALDPALLRREFGKNAEYLIDHAWGQEPCTIQEIKAYRPRARSLSNGQVLPCDYAFDEARTVVGEMAEESVLDLVGKGCVCGSVSLYVGYAHENVQGPHGQTASVAAPATGGERRLAAPTDLLSVIRGRLLSLFDQTTRRDVPVRRLTIGLGGLSREGAGQASLFDGGALGYPGAGSPREQERERRLERALAEVRERYGGAAVLRAASCLPKATARERAGLVGGHRA